MKKLVSIIAPVYNEATVIEEFVARVVRALAPLEGSYAFEILLVNDGSGDRSFDLMRGCLLGEPRLRLIDLARHYGQTAALQAGLDAARGEILVTMDADLQHFPQEIPRFLATLEQGYDMVCGWRQHRAEGILRRWPSRAANFLIRLISGLHLHDFGTTYRAYTSELTKDLQLLGEFHRYIPVLGHVAGARITEIPIENVKRSTGHSHYGLTRTPRVFLDLIVLLFLSRYLDRPMRAFGALGLLAFGLGGSILAFLLIWGWVFDIPTVRLRSGWFLVSLMLILAAVQIILTGVLAEILVRVRYEQGGRRVYRVRREWNTEAPAAAPAEPRARAALR